MTDVKKRSEKAKKNWSYEGVVVHGSKNSSWQSEIKFLCSKRVFLPILSIFVISILKAPSERVFFMGLVCP